MKTVKKQELSSIKRGTSLRGPQGTTFLLDELIIGEDGRVLDFFMKDPSDGSLSREGLFDDDSSYQVMDGRLYPHQSWTIAFFEGYIGLTDFEERFQRACESIGCRTAVIDQLYVNPSRIREAVDYDTWSLQTTGLNTEGLDAVFAEFRRLGYLPKRVVFPLGEDEFLWFINSEGIRGKVEFYRVLNEDTAELVRLDYLDE